MKKFFAFCGLVISFVFVHLQADAQTYYHDNGGASFTVAGNTIYNSGTGGGATSSYCNIYPFLLYQAPDYIKFVFASPVNAIRLHLVHITSADTVGVMVNGQSYYINNINLSAVTLSNCTTVNTNFAYSGYIAGSTNSYPPHPLVQFDIAGNSIDSVEIYMAANNGPSVSVGFDFYFAYGCLAARKVQADTPCSGDSLHLSIATNIVDASVTYNWSGPNNFTSTLQNPVIANIQSNGAGVYHVITTDDTCLYDDSVMVTVVPQLIQSAGSNSPLCNGDSLSLLAVDTVTGINWHWAGPNNFSDTLQNTFRSPTVLADSGNYIVTATMSNCSKSDTLHVVIKPAPATPMASSNSPVCMGDSLELGIGNLQAGVSYLWTGPFSYSSNIASPVRTNVILSDSGKYIIKATLNGCTSKADTIDVVINPLVTPSVTITSVPFVIPAGHTDTFTAHVVNCSNPTYQWYINNNPITAANNSNYIASLAVGDHISVSVHCSGCVSADSVGSNLLGTTRVTSPVLSKGEVMVWPNPLKDELNIEIVGQAVNNGVKIFDMVGRMVYGSVINENKTVISTKDFHTGTYILEITNNDGSREIKKIVKE